MFGKIDEVKQVVQEWLDKQGHDRCWYYPELFNQLTSMLEITPTVEPNLPPREEFEKGCFRFQSEQYKKAFPTAACGEEELKERCVLIVEKIVELANSHGSITFEEDWGDNTLTIIVKDKGHTHVGVPHGSFNVLVNNLFNSLRGGPGLSWV